MSPVVIKVITRIFIAAETAHMLIGIGTLFPTKSSNLADHGTRYYSAVWETTYSARGKHSTGIVCNYLRIRTSEDGVSSVVVYRLRGQKGLCRG